MDRTAGEAMIAALALLAAWCAWLLVPVGGLTRLQAQPVARVKGSRRSGGWSWSARIGVGVLGFLLVWLLLPSLLGVLLGAVAAAGIVVATGFLRVSPAVDVETREAPEALEFLAVCLEAGAPTQLAIRTVADVSPPATRALLLRVLGHLEVGRSAEESWAELREHPVWGHAARDMVRSARSGTRLVEVLGIHAEDAREVQRDRDTKRARTVGVKSVVPLMACFLPAFVLVGVVPIVASLLGQFFG